MTNKQYQLLCSLSREIEEDDQFHEEISDLFQMDLEEFIAQKKVKPEEAYLNAQRLRYIAIETEYLNCFDCLSREEFIASFDKTPEEGFCHSYESFMKIPHKDMRNEFIVLYGEDMLEDFSTYNVSTSFLIKSMDAKYQACLMTR